MEPLGQVILPHHTTAHGMSDCILARNKVMIEDNGLNTFARLLSALSIDRMTCAAGTNRPR